MSDTKFLCCGPCCSCCDSEEETDKDIEKHGKELEIRESKMRKGAYHQLPEDDDDDPDHQIILPQFEKVPLEKVFQFKQPQTPLTVHPMIVKGLSFSANQPTEFYSIDAHTPVEKFSLLEGSSWCSSPLSASAPFDFPSDLPRIDFIVHYDFQLCALTVNLLSAQNLPAVNQEGTLTLHPFVTLFLLPHREDIFRSKTSTGNKNAVFNETFKFSSILYEEICERTLILRVLDERTFRNNNIIGNVILPLHKTELHGVRVSAVLSEDNDIGQCSTNGDVQLTLRYNPSVNEVSGIVIKATSLNKVDITGLADPYVEIKVYYKGERKHKWKSSVAKKTLAPVFNQDFTFDLGGMVMDDVVLKLILKDHDLLTKDDFMGIVEFGKFVDHPSGCTHWNDMIANPSTRITRWHFLDQHSVGVFHFLHLKAKAL